MAKQQAATRRESRSRRENEQEADRDQGNTGHEDEVEEDDEPSADASDEFDAEEDDEPAGQGKAPPDFEADMHELQTELGEDWIVRFSVQGDEGWLTAEKEDGSQHVEAPTAEALIDTVELINESGGRST